MPIKGPRASVPTVTGALHVPPGGRTLAWMTGAVNGPPSHAVTARPSGQAPTAGFVPWPTRSRPSRSARRRWYRPVRKSCCRRSAGIRRRPTVQAALTASPGWDPDDAHPAGSWTGGDHELAACGDRQRGCGADCDQHRQCEAKAADGLGHGRPPCGLGVCGIRRIASRARRGGRAQKQAADRVTRGRCGSPLGVRRRMSRAYTVTRPGLPMAQATLARAAARSGRSSSPPATVLPRPSPHTVSARRLG